MAGWPKARLVLGESSSPLGWLFSGSPCGSPSPAMQVPLMHVRSFQVRFMTRLTIDGFTIWPRSVDSRLPYRLADAFSAVLPLPNRS